jgi:hypothetical protein
MPNARTGAVIAALATAALAGCSKPAAEGVTRADCEHVLAHLVVLEKDEAARPISKYHPSGGDGKEAFLGKCPKALSVKEVDCYLRATSLASADDCLHRTELDQRIGGAVAKPGGAPGEPPRARLDEAIAKLSALRDRTCACKDLACAEAVQQELEPLELAYADVKDDPALEARARPVFEALVACHDRLEAAQAPSRSSQAIDELRTLRDRACACKDEACGVAVLDDLTALGTRYKDDRPSDDLAALAKQIAEQLMECVAKVTPPGAPPPVQDPPMPPSATPPATTGATGVPACDDYVAKMERFLACDQVPADAREGGRMGLDAMRQSWGDLSQQPEANRKAAADGCKVAADAIVESGKAMGCAM